MGAIKVEGLGRAFPLHNSNNVVQEVIGTNGVLGDVRCNLVVLACYSVALPASLTLSEVE